MTAYHGGAGWLDVRDGIDLRARSGSVPDPFSKPSIGPCLLGFLTQGIQTILRFADSALLVSGESVRTCLGHTSNVARFWPRSHLGWLISNLSLLLG